MRVCRWGNIPSARRIRTRRFASPSTRFETICFASALPGLHPPRAKSDRATVVGIVVAGGSILAGMVLEGGKLGDIVQVTAGLIVLGGTLGAVMVNSPPAVLWRAARRLSTLFRPEHIPTGLLIEDLVACAAKARKQGLLSLEADVQAARDPFLRKALAL